MSKLTKVAFKLLDLLVIFMMTFGSPMSVMAHVWTDPIDYPPGSTVWIQGNNDDDMAKEDGSPWDYLEGETVDVFVDGPGDWTSSCSAVVDATGYWTCSITLDPDPAVAVGEYTYTATGLTSGKTEIGTFTDGKQILRACRNQPGPTLNTWDAGTTIQNSNSVYAEGESIPFVWTIKAGNPAPQLQEGVTYTIQLDYAFRGGTTSPEKFFFDYLTSYNATEPATSPFTAVKDGGTGFTGGYETTVAIPTDLNPAIVGQTGGNFSLFNIDPTSIVFTGTGLGYTVDPVNNNQEDRRLTFTFTPSDNDGTSGEFLNVGIAWGAHLATQVQYGRGNGAASFPGAQPQMVVDLNPTVSGDQTNLNINPNAVVAQGQITIIKDTMPNDPQDFGFTITGPSGANITPTFTLDDDADPTLSNQITFFGLVEGVYTITENVTSGWSLTGLTATENGVEDTTTADVYTIDLGARQIQITVANGEVWTTTFTNSVNLTPSLSLLKQISTSASGPWSSSINVTAGDSIYYQFTITNTGNVALDPISVTDPTLSGEESCSWTPAAPLAPSASSTCVIGPFTAATTAGTYPNTATAHGVYNGTTYDSDPSTAEYIVAATPALSMTKSVTSMGPYDSVGDEITYELVVTNTGNVTLTNVSISDPLLGILTCTQPVDLDPTDTLTCTGSYLVTLADLNAGKVDNTATTTGYFGEDEYTDTDSKTVPMSQNPAIDLTKTVTSTGPYDSVGDEITYELVATNTGNVTLTNVSISDPLLGTLTCTGSYLVTLADLNAGKVDNTATTTGYFGETPYTDSDSKSVPMSQNPAIDLTKSVTSTGPYDSVGDEITYELVATNTGNVTLTNVSISDPLLGTLTCSQPVDLDPGETLTCTGSYLVTLADLNAGKVDNTATTTGYFGETPYTDTDSKTVPMTQTPAISMNKVTVDESTSGDELNILVGEAITWKYLVKNTGNVTLYNVTITDNRGVDIDCDGGTNTTADHVIASLAPNATVTCTASGTAAKDGYTNTGSVSAMPPTSMPQTPVTASDDSSYFGADPQIAVAKVTVDGAYSGDGGNILSGESIKWRYTVTNVGNVPLSSVSVDDNMLSTANDPVYISGDTNSNNKLDLTEAWIFEASGTAITDSYSNTGTAKGSYTDSGGHTRTDEASDDSSYFGANPQIDIVKVTVGSDGTEGDNVFVLVGGTVTWKYYVTNTGNVALSSVSVTDSQGVAVTCPETTLAVGESMTCTATGTNSTPAGSWYNNTGTAEGSYTDSGGHTRTATDSDTSAYYSGNPGAVTNSSLCDFGEQFRLIFTPDMARYTSSTPYYKLSDSNPGQFFYNVFYTNDGNTDTITLEIPYPFVTQGANPVHVYDSLTVDEYGCLQPTDAGEAYGYTFTLSSYTDTNGDGKVGFGDVYLVNVPAEEGFQYTNIHLDYGLEKKDGWLKKGANATSDGTGKNPAPAGLSIIDNTPHTFKAYADGSLIPGSTDTVYNLNEFKQIRGFGGFVYIWNDTLDEYEPVVGAVVKLYKGTGTSKTRLEDMTTDADGWYLSNYIHKGKEATYTLAYNGKTIVVKVGGALKYGEGIFYIGGTPPTP